MHAAERGKSADHIFIAVCTDGIALFCSVKVCAISGITPVSRYMIARNCRLVIIFRYFKKTASTALLRREKIVDAE